ncbi:uncharacterized protein MAM_02489 [Metarhizium album ARSEF 1941]|uniref:GPI anchored serine-rich protein n=1 Tax=Metarhizium album (strain ARSEF 1941) TaxID=1081103 RepID=A0A0B2WU88_METAS|nr:uncharacterized protein MAM_02489 [Metarhizium album ARSEF 1941]KHN99636.1 hypothetical protein MAM_02489 [Metarhizium album ARSEF 1941]
MRFTAAAALMAGSAIAATSTDYTTTLVTITACPESVTNCPARSTQIQTSVLPLTTSTVYSTKVYTITSCAPEVTNCPAHSTVLSTATVAVSTTVCPVGKATGLPAPGPWNISTNAVPLSTQVVPVPVASGPATQAPPAANTESPVQPEAPACPSQSVTAITKSYTTVLTSVEYSTINVPCPTAAAPQGTGKVVPVPSSPPAGGNAPAGGNQTTPSGNNSPPVAAGAASFAGSATFAAVVGIAAFVLA